MKARGEVLLDLARIAMPDADTAVKLGSDLEEAFAIWDRGDLKAWGERMARAGIRLSPTESDVHAASEYWANEARAFTSARMDWSTASLMISGRGGKRQWSNEMNSGVWARRDLRLVPRGGLPDLNDQAIESVVLSVEVSWVPDGEITPTHRRMGMQFIRVPGSQEWIIESAAIPGSGRPSAENPHRLPPI